MSRPNGEFKFAPGQYATLGVERPEKRSERPYSIVSSPYENEIEFFFELVPQGELTPHIYKLQVGDEMLMRKVPKGRFTLDTKSGRTNHLLVSTVTGVAPFVSYVRSLHKDWKEGKFAGDQKLFLLNGASRSWEFGYLDELRKFAAEVPWLTYVPTVSRPWDDPKWTGEIGRVDDLIRKYADMWGLNGTNSVGYLCGHPEMIERGKGMLQRIGFTKEVLKEEIYWIPGKEPASIAERQLYSFPREQRKPARPVLPQCRKSGVPLPPPQKSRCPRRLRVPPNPPSCEPCRGPRSTSHLPCGAFADQRSPPAMYTPQRSSPGVAEIPDTTSPPAGAAFPVRRSRKILLVYFMSQSQLIYRNAPAKKISVYCRTRFLHFKEPSGRYH